MFSYIATCTNSRTAAKLCWSRATVQMAHQISRAWILTAFCSAFSEDGGRRGTTRATGKFQFPTAIYFSIPTAGCVFPKANLAALYLSLPLTNTQQTTTTLPYQFTFPHSEHFQSPGWGWNFPEDDRGAGTMYGATRVTIGARGLGSPHLLHVSCRDGTRGCKAAGGYEATSTALHCTADLATKPTNPTVDKDAQRNACKLISGHHCHTPHATGQPGFLNKPRGGGEMDAFS